MASVVFVCKMWSERKMEANHQDVHRRRQRVAVISKRLFLTLSALLSSVPLPARLLLSLFDPLLNTHMLGLPPPHSLQAREREGTRQINVKISTNPRRRAAHGVGGGFPGRPSISRDAPSIRPSVFDAVKRADTGPFCRALIGHLVM